MTRRSLFAAFAAVPLIALAAQAATTFRDEYATTLAKVVEIDGNRQKLKLNDLNARVDALKKQKEHLDAQLAMDNAAANYDLALKQQRLSAEASVLQAEFTRDAAEASNQQRLAIEQLKVEIELIKREVELFKARQEAAAQEPR